MIPRHGRIYRSCLLVLLGCLFIVSGSRIVLQTSLFEGETWTLSWLTTRSTEFPDNASSVPRTGRDDYLYSLQAVPTNVPRKGRHRYLQDTPPNNDEESVAAPPSLGVNVSFEEIMRLSVFIAVAWFMGNLSIWLGLPGLVGEIMTGFLLGPPLTDFCPFPQAMVLVGNIGLIGLMLESGMHLDIAQLKETGSRAVLMAVTGTILALMTGLALGRVSSSDDFASAMAVGAAFAPSSLGVAASVLSSGQVLNTPIGQLIVASSVVDDVFGLILLSILNVFVMEEPSFMDFIRPFIASFGLLFLLGFVGIVWIPYWMNERLLPRHSSSQHEKATFAVMLVLLIIYLPALNYAGASYLTGAFLAGLSVSQLPSIHTSYARNGRVLMVWLMRIFFAATIGFQVPIRRYNRGFVLRLGVKFRLLVPNFRKDVPKGFPFNPYYRDVAIASLSVVCRGEFNFLVASFGLSEGLLGGDIYSAIVLAVLLSAVVAPLALSHVIRYYNTLAERYLHEPHDIDHDDKNVNDGYRPLFCAIQIRAPSAWNMHERFRRVLEEMGLLLLDHRSWHTNGLDSIDVTEIFVQDDATKILLKDCFGCTSLKTCGSESPNESSDVITPESQSNSGIFEEPSFTQNLERPWFDSNNATTSEVDFSIKRRLAQIRGALYISLGGEDATDVVVKVTPWEPFLSQVSDTLDPGHNRRYTYTFQKAINTHIGSELVSTRDPSVVLVEEDPETVPMDCEAAYDTGHEIRGVQQEEPSNKSMSIFQHSMYRREDNAGSTDKSTPENCDGQSSQIRTSLIHPLSLDENREHRNTRSISGGLHRRQRSSCRLHLTEDLWETDEGAHVAIRCDHYPSHPVVAGHFLSDDESAVDMISPRVWDSGNQGHQGSRTRLFSEEELETVGIERRLHGYVRH